MSPLFHPEAEHLVRAVEEERDKAQDRRHNRQHYRRYLVVKRTDILPDIGPAAPVLTVRVHDVYPRVHHYPAQHHQRGESALVEHEAGKPEYQRLYRFYILTKPVRNRFVEDNRNILIIARPAIDKCKTVKIK